MLGVHENGRNKMVVNCLHSELLPNSQCEAVRGINNHKGADAGKNTGRETLLIRSFCQ